MYIYMQLLIGTTIRYIVYIYICTYAYMHNIYIYICMYVCMHVCMYVCMYVCICVCGGDIHMLAYMYIYIYNTNTHVAYVTSVTRCSA